MTFSQRLDSIRIGTFSLSVILSALITLVLCLAARKLLKKLVDHALSRSKLDGTLRAFVGGAANVVSWVVIILIVADKLGIPMTSLVAVLSVAGLALSLSLQNLLSNLFSGVTILGTKPLVSGDYVDIGGTAGTVKAVGLFHTVIVTNDSKTVFIPNSAITSSTVVNYSTSATRRIDIVAAASYGDATEDVKAALVAAAKATKGVLGSPEPQSSIQEFAASSVKYYLWAWVDTPDYLSVKAALLENIRSAFAERGVSMTYDHINVHMVEK